ncbi:host attachment family protein [Agrobacterium sp. ES01]|uniref:host attachment family protein n=1 Tax=Agrobacterium sp. ES01 TaxID=3420714 RepID=UPI003D13D826
MSQFKVPTKSWVIVCDGARALFIQNDGDTEKLNLRVAERSSQEDEPSRDLGADRPGRSHQSVGNGRSAMEETDLHAQAEEAFLKRTAERVNEMVYDKTIEDYVLIAPPSALGTLRQHLNAASTDAASAEIPKDLTNQPITDIEKHLTRLRAA